MTGPLLIVQDRCQSRAYRAPSGMIFGVAASKGFDEPAIKGGIAEHATAAFARMTNVLDAAGLTPADVSFVTVYLSNVLRDVDGFNAVWRRYFDGLAPARCCIGAELQAGMLVEMTFCAEGPTGHHTDLPISRGET